MKGSEICNKYVPIRAFRLTIEPTAETIDLCETVAIMRV